MKLLTEAKLKSIHKNYVKIDKQIAALRAKQERLEDVLDRSSNKVEDRFMWLDLLVEEKQRMTKKQREEHKVLKRYLDSIDRIQDKMWHRD